MQLFDALYRNGSWRLLLCFVLLALCELKEVQRLSAQTLDDPPDPPPEWIDLDYPASIHILGIQFDKDTRRTKAHGSDIWPITWAADDNQYSAFGDGGGFGGTNTDGRVSMGVARIQGKLTDYSGVNVWGGKHSEHRSQFKGKGTGIISVDGALYMWVARPKKITAETGLAVSHDYARTWQLADWHWTMKDRICAGAFLNAGRQRGSRPTNTYMPTLLALRRPKCPPGPGFTNDRDESTWRGRRTTKC